MGRLTGTWVLVDPSPLAQSLAAEGACVLVAGLSATEVAEAVAAIREAGGRADGWVGGGPGDPGAAEMAAELYPGCLPLRSGPA